MWGRLTKAISAWAKSKTRNIMKIIEIGTTVAFDLIPFFWNLTWNFG